MKRFLMQADLVLRGGPVPDASVLPRVYLTKLPMTAP